MEYNQEINSLKIAIDSCNAVINCTSVPAALTLMHMSQRIALTSRLQELEADQLAKAA